MSSQFNGASVELAAINGAAGPDTGIEHSGALLSFTEAVMRGDSGVLAREREALRAILSPEAFVDVCAVIGSFNVVDRIADATGIPLDEMMEGVSRDVREELNLARFASAANTPGATEGRD